MTDNEIKKALEWCCNSGRCKECPHSCLDNGNIEELALDLINRQKAEIERLLQKLQRPQDADPMDFCGVLCDFAEGLIAKAKAEAYKEFANELKCRTHEISYNTMQVVNKDDIDNLLKELVGEDK